jgi:predicted nucleic-acid-binding Zn-ribbon protein
MCEECNSANTIEELKNFNDDSHNILKVVTCKDCGHKKTELINII